MSKQYPKPQGSTWTDDQWDAITLSGQNMLVAAAAGSGKTAVLVERIIRRISDEWNPVDVDRLLVATFTKAAASEMKHRIREALEKELTKQPHSQHLRKQLALMGRASITTLHSFCLEVIQRYFSLIKLDPGFRIANETEGELLRYDLLQEMLEQYYSESVEDSAFWRLMDSFSGERSDDAIMQLILKLYDVSRSHPWPSYWLRSMASMFGPQPIVSAEPNMDEAAAAMQEAMPLVAAGAAPADYSLWVQSLVQDVKLELEGAADLLRQAQDVIDMPGGPAPYQDNLRDDLLLVDSLREAASTSWPSMYEAFQAASFGKLKACKGDDYDKELQEEVKELRNRAKDIIGKIREDLFGRTPEQFGQELAELAPVLHTLVDLVLDFGARYQAAKADKGLIDFADLEHYCLQILCQSGSMPGELYPSEAALAYRKQFAEVLLDEYQDTNRVQEAIVELISNSKPGNRFMVGDVKQSIYRFRLAEPGLFLEKYKAFRSSKESAVLESQKQQAAGLRIDLARNFRSRSEVVHAVNYVFKQVMNETVGEIEYDEQAELVYGAGYPPPAADCAVEMLIIDKMTEAEESSEPEENDTEPSSSSETSAGSSPSEALDPVQDAQELETVQLEARAMASQIRELVGEGSDRQAFQVFDKRTGGTRPATYRDIVILLRATSAWAPVIIEELKGMGIPAYADLSTGYFSATEVEVMISLLKVIDNPYQDVPLAAVLRSPIVQLTADELAQVRVSGKQVPFYEAVLQFVKNEAESVKEVQDATKDSVETLEERASEGFWAQSMLEIASGKEATQEGTQPFNEQPKGAGPLTLKEKLEHFLHLLEAWRSEARQGSLADLIWSIYRQTGYYDFAGGLPGGLQRQANLRALYDRARQYESTSLRGLFRFLRFIERMKDSGGDLGTARALGEQEDVVRIMSIHKSKGLEFPVVFVAGMAKMFNQRDLNDSFLLHKELGFGPRFVDARLRISYPTLPSLAIKRRMKLELLAEEMRVLYVALTRAREKLYLLGTVKSLDKLLRAWGRNLSRTQRYLPDYELAKAKCYLDWVGPALLRHPHAKEWRERLGIGEAASGVHLLSDASSWRFRIVKPESLITGSQLQEGLHTLDREMLGAVQALKPVDSAGQWSNWLDHRLSWTYTYAKAPKLFSKTTVSEMKRLSELNRLTEEMELPVAQLNRLTEEMEPPVVQLNHTEQPVISAARSVLPGTSVLRRPRFMEKKKLTAAERGTVVHAVMQNLPLTEPMTASIVQDKLAYMLEKQLLTEEQCAVVDIPTILNFFETPIGRRMLQAGRVQREVPFSYGLSAMEVYHAADRSTEGETVLIQGVIDCLFEDQNGLVLVDYKTDAVKGRSVEELRSRYEVQVTLYARAVEHIWKRPVTGKYLYFFDGSLLIDM
ncbi:helicase-exonuclease AddAB subunit AddA [Paenibacillus hexagrammi]|uniref:ATP-dependent helicase/nuclease subunit A n=1 Tax=Paenibacillus hexagrammi TaxID=2908839 RepID=A0ABY3SPL3_9BACL|nr:helicase-exonuclease AddAB subunit AddA [Paenibacillus sp. YPD9-1]UJF35065.1 helicase-exonuclease AddAB subunit AddA [Paenibacillus sp. YPD9-1]